MEKNYCYFKEVETLLKESGSWYELKEVYQSKKSHRQALDIITNHPNECNKEKNNLFVTPEEKSKIRSREISKYLIKLGKKNKDLIMEYSLPVLLQSPQIGLTIFIEEDPIDDEPLDPEHVLTHLKVFINNISVYMVLLKLFKYGFKIYYQLNI